MSTNLIEFEDIDYDDDGKLGVLFVFSRGGAGAVNQDYMRKNGKRNY